MSLYSSTKERTDDVLQCTNSFRRDEGIRHLNQGYLNALPRRPMRRVIESPGKSKNQTIAAGPSVRFDPDLRPIGMANANVDKSSDDTSSKSVDANDDDEKYGGIMRMLDTILNPKIEIDWQYRLRILFNPFYLFSPWITPWTAIVALTISNKLIYAPGSSSKQWAFSNPMIICFIVGVVLSYFIRGKLDKLLLKSSRLFLSHYIDRLKELVQICMYIPFVIALCIDGSFYFPFLFMVLGSIISIDDMKIEKSNAKEEILARDEARESAPVIRSLTTSRSIASY
jgi:hypothetical protein